MKAKITGLGKYLPERVMTNFDLEKIVETSDEWITTRTGIKERRIAAEGEATSNLATKAAEMAIQDAGIDKNEIDFILVATITPDMAFPATACLVQNALGIECATLDIEAACSGFIYGLALANGLISSGMYKNILVIGAETLSRITDYEDRATCVLFGDGAGAAVVSASDDEEAGFVDFSLGGDGNYTEMLHQPAGGSLKPASIETVKNREHYLRMQGNATFKVAVRKMSGSMSEILQKHSIEPNELRWLIPHQANLRIMTAVGERIGIDLEKVYVNLEKYGNTSAATIPIAMCEAKEQGKIEKGDLIGLVAFGGGLTWGSTIIKW